MDYMIKMSTFDGPLDLLLHLIKKDNINIYDIPIGTITKQYMDYITKMEELNLNLASSYLVMAAELMEMKSRSLLPINEEVELEEEEDPKIRLIERLLEYQQYKESTQALRELEQERQTYYTKDPSNIKEYQTETQEHEVYSFDLLLDALKQMMEREEQKRPVMTKIVNKEYSVYKRSSEIKALLKEKKQLQFDELFEQWNKEYIVVTFLSILDLSKKGEIIIDQLSNFAPILLKVQEENV